MDKYTVRMYDSLGNCRIEEICFYFRYVKEMYTPYVYFEGKFLSTEMEIGEITMIEFWKNYTMLHRGLVDSIEIIQSNNRPTVYVRSKGFTSLLCQNQPEPGIMKEANLEKIIATFPDIPYITYEDTDNENYIYIKDGSTVWDAICNLCYRKKGIYPYIEQANKVRISPKNVYMHMTISEGKVIEKGVKHDFTRLISHIHMQDIEGSYSFYNQESTAALSRNIIRHKQIPLDRQFLYNPSEAPDYKLKFSMRGMIYRYIKYDGFMNDDLFDLITCGDFFRRARIHRVETVFDGGRVLTEIGNYNDGFFS